MEAAADCTTEAVRVMSDRAPTWRDVEAAKQATLVGQQSLVETVVLPWGYLSGCALSVSATNTLAVALGVVEVAGRSVRILEVRNPLPAEWDVEQLNGLTYYVYIDNSARLHIDILPPAFRADLFGEYHITHAYRYLGRFTLTAGFVTTVINQGAVSETEIEAAVNSDIAEGVQALIDAGTAQATADGKIVTFYADDPPTAEGTGDLWLDTNDGNKLYRWSGSAWTEVQDDDIATAIADAATAQTTAAGKIVTFFQDAIPTATDAGDLWIDTNDKNKLYRSTNIGDDEITAGEWETARDTDVAQAISDAAGAQATADGKIVTFYQDDIPTATDIGDLWIDTNDGNKLYRSTNVGDDEIKAGEWVTVQDDGALLVPSENLIGWWTLDDGSGTTAIDSSVNGNYGTLEGSAPTWVDGKSGKAVNFPGTNERVDCGNSAPLDDIGNGSFWLSFWMKSKDTVPLLDGRLFDKLQGNDDFIVLFSTGTTNRLRFGLKSGGVGVLTDFSTDSTPFDTELNHIVLVVNRTTDLATVYVNTIKDTTEIDISSCPADCRNTGNVSWGARNNGLSPYEGLLDECRIYSGLPTESDILALYTNPGGYSPGTVTVLGQALLDAAGAQATADGKIVTFYQAGIPTATDIGDLWIDTDDGNKLYRSTNVGDDEIKAGEWVTVRDTDVGKGRVIVGALGYAGLDAQYQCDGTADQVQINAAIADGYGIVELTFGQYNTTATIEGDSSVILQGRGAGTVIEKNGDFHGIQCVGSEGSEKVNFQIRDLKVTRNAADTNAKSLIYLEYTDNYLISNVFFEDYYNSGFRNNYSDFGLIIGCHFNTATEGVAIYISFGLENTMKDNFIDGGATGIFVTGGNQIYGNSITDNHIKNLYSSGQMRAIYISGDDNEVINNTITDCLSYYYIAVVTSLPRGVYIAGSRNKVTGNRIDNCVYTGLFIESGKQQTLVANNFCKDNGQLIDRGNGESATSPMVTPETVPVLSNATWARSSVQAYEGTYSYKFTKNNAPGDSADVDLVDNNLNSDLHGVIPGLEYTLSMRIFIPSGGILGSEIELLLIDYIPGVEITRQAAANTYDEWQIVTVTRTIRSAATGFILRIESAVTRRFLVAANCFP